MNEQLELLKKLQDVDSAIISLADEIDQLSKKIGNDSLLLKQAQASYNISKAKSDEAVKKRKDKERELQEIHDTINKSKAKSGALKTNKEYEAHLREIESFQKKTERIEEEILTIMVSADALTNELKEEGLKLKKAEEECKKDEQLIENEKKKLLSDMTEYKSKRTEFTDKIDPDNYEIYMNLLKKHGRTAVAEAENEICLGCNTNIPPQLFNEVKENRKIINCFYCYRFLYYKDK
ncbi:MAG: C4-type zinc ribbon domain-containing protein [Thermodesulfovibrionia bacterium]|nr:C4-type zinc ribbon domain-containing protein [Thermodesulfovibrionia bacterium]